MAKGEMVDGGYDGSQGLEPTFHAVNTNAREGLALIQRVDSDGGFFLPSRPSSFVLDSRTNMKQHLIRGRTVCADGDFAHTGNRV